MIPGQGTCLGGRFRPYQGVYKKQPIDVSLLHGCFSPSLPLSLKSISISSGEDKKEKEREAGSRGHPEEQRLGAAN